MAKQYQTESISSTQLPGALPTTPLPDEIDCGLVASTCIAYLNKLEIDNLTTDSFWRDCLCMTGTIRTFHTSASIITAWQDLHPQREPCDFQYVDGSAQVFNLSDGRRAWVTAMFTFETAGEQASKCSGMCNLVPDGKGSWKIWAFSTLLEELKGVERGNPDDMSSTSQSVPLPNLTRSDSGINQEYFDCLVVGAGMSGLCTASRLQALGVSYVAVDRNREVGENWSKRYDSAKLHLSKSYSEMPFKRVYMNEPYYLTSQHLAQGLRDFVAMHHLNAWTSTEVESATWIEGKRLWDVKLTRNGEPRTVRTKHLVMALGGGVAKPVMPIYEGRDNFGGDVIHSATWKNAHAYKGKQGIVVGSANTAFDVAEDMVEAGLSSVTMIQRSPTHVVPENHFRQLLDKLYNPQMDVGLADRILMGPAYAMGRLIVMDESAALLEQEKGRYDAISAAGFRVKLGPDMLADVVERLGGHFLDVGTTRLIENGKLKIKSDSLPIEYTHTGLGFADGSKLAADVIVFCTGFNGSMRTDTADIVGDTVAAKLDDFFGLNKEGELRGLAVPIGHPGIWYLGGGTAYARFMSRFLALQIKADVEGIPFSPYVRSV